MYVEDREVLREVWEGRIPAVFNLAENDIDTEMENAGDPEPFHLLLPRMSYFPLSTDKVFKHFKKHCKDPNQNCVWFDFKGTPLKWHHPVGALYDVLKGGKNDNDDGLPWQLTVHFSGFPSKELIPFSSRESIASQYMSSVKEADQLKHGGRVVSTMQKKDHQQLWTGLQNDKFDQFWAINRRFMETVVGEDNFKHIPIRFHECESKCIVQKLVKPVNEATGANLTFGDLNDMYYPSAKLILQGIVPAPETPLEWLSRHLSYPDNFLHIAVHPSN